MIALDNDAVHTSQVIVAAQPHVAAAHVALVYLARSCPAQSGSEPVWNDGKQQQLPIRSVGQVADLTHAVDDALARTAQLCWPGRSSAWSSHYLATISSKICALGVEYETETGRTLSTL